MRSTDFQAFAGRKGSGLLLLLVSECWSWLHATDPARIGVEGQAVRAGPFDNAGHRRVHELRPARALRAALASTLNNRPHRKTAATASSTKMAASEVLARIGRKGVVHRCGRCTVNALRQQEVKVDQTQTRR